MVKIIKSPAQHTIKTMAQAVRDDVLEKVQWGLVANTKTLRREMQAHAQLDKEDTQILADEINKIREEFDKLCSEIPQMIGDAISKELKSHFEDRNSELLALIRAIPLPQVHVETKSPIVNVAAPTVNPQIHVPKDAVKVDMQPSVVHVAAANVNIPKDAIKVNVESKPSVVNVSPQINVPKQAPPTINVNPELHPVFHVDASRKGKVTKKIIYEKGKPVQIIEEVEE